MEKLALFEVGLTSIRLTLATIKEGEQFRVLKQFYEPTGLAEHIESEQLIKGAKIKECVSILQMLKKICEAEGVNRYVMVALNSLTLAKNYMSFVDECSNSVGIEFRVQKIEEEVGALFTAATNTLDVQKGVVVYISSHSTRIVNYNRRIVLDSAEVPIGSADILKVAGGKTKDAIELFKVELAKHAPLISGLDPETVVVGVGDTFAALAKLTRKINKYPVDREHGFEVSLENFHKAFSALDGIDPTKRQKLRGISDNPFDVVLGGLCIACACVEFAQAKGVIVADAYRNIGMLYQHALPFTIERPVTDILGYSLDVIVESVGLNKRSCERMYELSLMLFKQFKVLHKLPRGYARVLRVGAFLYNIGKMTNATNPDAITYHTIMDAPLLGVSHKDIVLAAFCASTKRWENFNLAEWVKYRDIMEEEDIEAVRKISNMLTIADALNIRDQDVVREATCDILGDSVILKLLTEMDAKGVALDPNAAFIEIYHAKKFAGEFERAFKKKLEIL